MNADLKTRGNDGKVQYERGLDLETGTAWVYTKYGEQEVRREYFCSCPDQCMVMHLESKQALSRIDIRLESELKMSGAERKHSHRMKYHLQCPEHVDPNYVDSREPVIWGDRGKKFSVYISITETDGKVEEECGYLSVSGVKNITVVLTAVNNPVITDTYEKLRKMHQEDYKNLYGRTELYLGEQPNIPTDVRLRNLREGQQDNALYALYFQYGRYLMISSSRGEDSLPATLQGIWCWEMQPPWSSNWTTNINTQMNYWMVHKCNLSECVKPYVEWMKQWPGQERRRLRNISGAEDIRSITMLTAGMPHRRRACLTAEPGRIKAAVNMHGFRWEAYGSARRYGVHMNTVRIMKC